MKRMPFTLRQRRRDRQGGFSLIELLVVISIIMIILFFAGPKLLSILQSSRETGAITAIKTIQTEQFHYQSTFNRFASTLTQLGPPATGGTVGPEAADLIPASLATGHASGYLVTMTATPNGYTVLAVPQNGAGRRTFYSDESGIVRENWGAEPATANSPEVGSSSATK
jgi:prepilin-type N-terminal cleavage/methylation domain-containing protein